MHILYFHQHFGTPLGSSGTRSYEMARRMVERGHRVTMVCGSYAQSSTGLAGPYVNGRRTGAVDGINVIELDLAYANSDGLLKRAYTFLKFAARSARIAATTRADVAFATTTPLTAAIPGLAAKWIRRTPFVFEVRDLWPELPRAMGVITNPVVLGMMGALEWTAYKSADRLIGLSPGILRGVSRFGAEPAHVAMIPNGCDFSMFDGDDPPAVRPAAVRPTDFLAVFAGTHGVANGLDAVIDAAQEIKRRGIADIKLLLVGTGKSKDALVASATERGVRDVVIFMPPMPKRDLAGLLRACDAGMQILANVPAFYYGTSPNKFFDYLAVGLPVLTNYPGWIADIVAENDIGIAVPPGDPSAFVDGLLTLQRQRAAGKAGRTYVRSIAKRDFDRDILADRLIDVVESAVMPR
jgi:glycosyltransferase involved in cell wall biosynthesis